MHLQNSSIKFQPTTQKLVITPFLSVTHCSCDLRTLTLNLTMGCHSHKTITDHSCQCGKVTFGLIPTFHVQNWVLHANIAINGSRSCVQSSDCVATCSSHGWVSYRVSKSWNGTIGDSCLCCCSCRCCSSGCCSLGCRCLGSYWSCSYKSVVRKKNIIL